MRKFTLTGNELATAWFACGHSISWWKNQKPQSAYTRKERLKYEALMAKLGDISDYAYPYRQRHEDESQGNESGDEQIMQSAAIVVRKTRQAARKFDREN